MQEQPAESQELSEEQSTATTPAATESAPEAPKPGAATRHTATAATLDRDVPPAADYKIKLETFEGPLDLLLHLIRKEEMSIYDIQIARITEQYLEYLSAMQNLDIGVAGEFLVMAATLIHIKSQMLLPRDPDAPEGEVEDPRADLVNQLLEHQKFKAAANALHQRATLEAATFTRAPLETDEDNPEVAATIFQLFEVFQEILNRRKAIAELEIVRDRYTMAEKIHQIRTLVSGGKPVKARELFERARSKHEMVMIFLGILEMVKNLIITLVQQETFGEIILALREGAPAPDEMPLAVELPADGDTSHLAEAFGAGEIEIDPDDEIYLEADKLVESQQAFESENAVEGEIPTDDESFGQSVVVESEAVKRAEQGLAEEKFEGEASQADVLVERPTMDVEAEASHEESAPAAGALPEEGIAGGEAALGIPEDGGPEHPGGLNN